LALFRILAIGDMSGFRDCDKRVGSVGRHLHVSA
jgi:hypothetical protein